MKKATREIREAKKKLVEALVKVENESTKTNEIQAEEVTKLNSLMIATTAYRKLVILAANQEPMQKLHRYCSTILTMHANEKGKKG